MVAIYLIFISVRYFCFFGNLSNVSNLNTDRKQMSYNSISFYLTFIFICFTCESRRKGSQNERQYDGWASFYSGNVSSKHVDAHTQRGPNTKCGQIHQIENPGQFLFFRVIYVILIFPPEQYLVQGFSLE